MSREPPDDNLIEWPRIFDGDIDAIVPRVDLSTVLSLKETIKT